jgi:hypothetical protein
MSALSKARKLHIRHRRPALRLQLESLEQRTLLSTNVLVNNTAEDIAPHDVQSETAIVLGSGSNVISAFNDSGSYNGSNNHFTGWSTSSNGGSSWTDQGILPVSSAGDAGDPVLARDTSSGRVYLATLSFSVSNVLQVFNSDNNGATFSAPVNGAPGVRSSDTVDKGWITVDNFAGKGQGTVYTTFTDFSASGSTSIDFEKSTNNGGKFSSANAVASGTVQGSNVVVGTDHSIYIFYLSGGGGTLASIQVVKSTNLGKKFGKPVTVASLTTTGVNGDLGLNGGFRTNTFPQVAVNPVNGNLYAVFDDVGQAAGDRADVYFTQSTNGGSTWSTPTKLNDDTTSNDQWFPAIAVTPDGTHLGVFWYDRRLDPSNSLIDRFGTVATISGSTVTFGANFRVTNTSFPVNIGRDPNVVSSYMGDYDMAAADNNFFYTTWGDNRTASTTGPDVYFDTVSTSGVPSGPVPSGQTVATVSLPGGSETSTITAGITASPWAGNSKTLALSPGASEGFANVATPPTLAPDRIGTLTGADEPSTAIDQLFGLPGLPVRKHRAFGA